MLVIKVGGGAGLDRDAICRDVAELAASGERIVLVHGANAERDALANRMSVPLRTVVSPSGVSSVYTDRAGLDVFLMAYPGLANTKLVAGLRAAGVDAVGLSGVDGGIWRAKAKKDLQVREGARLLLLRGNLTGRVESADVRLLRLLLDHGFLPVLSPPALSFENEIVNVDGDWAAAVLAEALEAEEMVFLFAAPGLLADPDDERSLVPRVGRDRLEDFLGAAGGRMKKKILGARRAFEGGVRTIYWGDGRIASPVAAARAGLGTVIR